MMPAMLKTTAIVLLAGLAGACVTKGKYNALQKQLDDTRDTLTGQVAERDKTIGEREQRIKDLEDQIRIKDGEIAAATGKDQTSQEEIARLQTEKGRLES